jgi:Glyoxalase-like domain
MTSRIAVLAIDALDPQRVAGFWCQVLGWTPHEGSDGAVTIAPPGSRPSSGDFAIDIVPVPETKTVKNRLHLDIRADGTTRDDELARLLALGARRVDVGQGRDVTWVVLADPEGNEFCLLQRTVEEAARA